MSGNQFQQMSDYETLVERHRRRVLAWGDEWNRAEVLSDLLRRMARRATAERRLRRDFVGHWCRSVQRAACLRLYLSGMALRVAYWRSEAKQARGDFDIQRWAARNNFEVVVERDAEIDQLQADLADADAALTRERERHDLQVQRLTAELERLSELNDRMRKAS